MLDLSGFSFHLGQTFCSKKNKNTYMQQNNGEEDTFSLCQIIYLGHR